MSRRIRWITTTGVLLAMLIAVQAATAFGGQLLTGSCVNLILAVAALIGGLWCGVTVALLSPFFAFLLGVGPKLLPLVPCISVGNAVFAALLYFLAAGKGTVPPLPRRLGAAVASAACKFLTLWLLVVQLVLPALSIPDAQRAAMSAMFTWPQLATALVGGILAVLLQAPLARTLGKHQAPPSQSGPA